VLDVGSKNNSQSKTDRYRQKYTEAGWQILILYATEYGFSKELACELFDRLSLCFYRSDLCIN